MSPLPVRLVLASGLATAALTLAEVGHLAARGDVSPGAAAWLGLATFTLTLPVAGALLLLVLPVALPRRAASRVARLHARLPRSLRLALGGSLLAGSAYAYWLDVRAYVRLYLSLHLGLGLAAVLLGQLGFLALLSAFGARAVGATEAPPPPTRRARIRRLAVVAAVIAAWLIALGGSLAHVLFRPKLRFLALERTTILAHELLALHAAYGILAPPQQATWILDDPRLVDSVRPAPLGAPAAPLRGANVVLLTVDGLRHDRVPPGGRIEALAARGVAFDRAYTAGCATVLAMAPLLTSRLASQLRLTFVSVDTALEMRPHARDEPLVSNPANWRKTTLIPWDDPTPTLAGHLRAAGYVTLAPIAYVFFMRRAGLTRDFDVIDETPYVEHNRDLRGVTSPQLTDSALAMLAARDPGRPFFLWIHYTDPHAPYTAHDPAAEGQGAEERYRSELRLVDRELGRLLDRMEDAGHLGDTIVIVTGDHGDEFREHGGQFHGTTLYEEIIRVALVVVLPARAGVPAPRRVATPVSHLDLAPTILDLVGAGAGGTFVGRSLLPHLRGDPAAAARPIFAECKGHGRGRRAVIDWPYKLIAEEGLDSAEIYDLERDPGERENRVELEPAAHRRLRAWLSAVDGLGASAPAR